MRREVHFNNGSVPKNIFWRDKLRRETVTDRYAMQSGKARASSLEIATGVPRCYSLRFCADEKPCARIADCARMKSHPYAIGDLA
jgi:hypothetical protein